MPDSTPDLSALSAAKRALLAQRLHARAGAGGGPRPRPGSRPAPLSFAQQRLWLIDQLQPGSAAYNVSRLLRLRGRLDEPALRSALTSLVARHEVLRTALVLDGDVPVGRVLAPDLVDLDVADVGDEPDPEGAARALALRDLRLPFDLARGRPLRARVVRLGDADHLLVLVLHHSVSDEDSRGVMFTELAELYAAAHEGRPAALEPLALQYGDYAAWERERQDGDLDWWREYLSGAPPELELPADVARPAAATARGGRQHAVVDVETLDRLRALARAEGATLFMALLAAFKLFLARSCASEDIVVGVPVSLRTRPQLEPLIGLFANTLVLRTALGGNPTFRALIGRVRTAAIAAFAHQDVPFERLVQALGPMADVNRPPWMQVLFNFIETPSPAVPALAGLVAEPVDLDPEVAKVDLALVARVRDDGLHLTWEYSRDRFAPPSIARFTDHLSALLRGAAAAPDTPIGELPMLSAGELEAATGDLARTTAPIAPGRLPDLVAARATERPDAIALRAGAAALSYAALEQRSDGLAWALIARGVRPGDLVGVLHGRSVDLVAALLAVHKAGAAYVPLDPVLPARRLAFMLEDSGVRVLVTERALLARAPTELLTVITDDAISAPAVAFPSGSPRDLAYVIYTSGSTGIPKGVAIEHRSLLNLLAGLWRGLGLGEHDRLLAVTTLSFDIAAFELFGPLLAGGEVILSQDGEASDPDALEGLLASSRASVMQATPSTWQMLVDAGWPGDPSLAAVCGGDTLPPGLAAALRERTGRAWNVYGPTETTIWSTIWPLAGAPSSVPIGQAIANTACYVLDLGGRPTPPGAIGELCIGGAGVARGYHRRPELTAERFVDDPFVAGGRMYRTGDLARRRADGLLEFIGRRDAQVKLRGFRIELGEIEATLAAHPGVRSVIAAVRPDPAGDGRLLAYVVGDVSAADLRAHAEASLPAQMVPSAFVMLDALPLTANGKVDRAALPAPELADAAAYRAPSNAVETRLAELFCAVLGVERIGTEDHFFAFGGHSLAATRLISRANAAFSIRLPLRSAFEAPTVASLARLVEQASASAPAARPARVARGAGRQVFPASFQQRRVWFLDRLDPGTALYNVPLCVRIRGPLDAAALGRALARLAARHEILRTTLPERHGQPEQVVHPPAPFAFTTVAAGDAEEAEAIARVYVAAPLDLARGPLARARLVSWAPDSHLLALVLHHAVADGWTLGLLMDDLSALLADHPLDDPPLAYADYAVWQHESLAGAALEAELAWWRTQLHGAPADLELPTDRPRPARPDHAGARHLTTFDADTLARLEALAAKRGATLFMVLACAVQALLVRYSGADDIVVGAPVAGRTSPETERIAGYLANTLVLRTDLSGDPSFAAAIDRTRATVVGALAHQEVPFDRLVEELATSRDLARNPLFDVIVMLQDDRPALPVIDGAVAEAVDLDRGVARFDLSISFARRDGGLRVAWEYATALFDASTVARFGDHFARLVKGALATPETPLSQLEIMPAAERARVIGTPRAIAPDCAHELVARRCAERPGATAILCAGTALTYAELDVRATLLARELIAHGAAPGTLVGLWMDRSVELLVAIHGVLRAGAAYIPLDPDYPSERVAFMLGDARASLVVSRRDLLGSLPAGDARVVCVDDPALARHPSEPVAPRAGLRDLAYVMYTSGSTGRPKGVMVEHRSLVNLLASMGRHPGLEPGETMLGLTTPAFDLSVPDLHLPLVRGARLALATPVEAADPQLLARLLHETAATVVQATPASWRMLLDFGWRPERPMRIVVGGEAVPAALAERLRNLMAEAWNFYGPTETTVWSTCCRARGVGGEVPIGRPLDNTACYVLDAHDRPVPVGVHGELHISGMGVARGYLNRPELTAQKFVADPFRPGERMYRTGDLARLLPDGQLAFAGRRDLQVKLRGFRIELAEITTTLEQHPAVRAAAVIVREDEPGDQRLVAYVVPDGAPTSADLRAHLAETLPAYMVPGTFVALELLPLNANGKLDVAALPGPDLGERAEPGAPRTPIEQQLLGLWTAALGRTDVGIHDNVFHLGAHSLLVTRVVARIRDALGVELPLREAYERPTVAALAAAVSAAMVLDEPDEDLAALLAEIERLPDDEATDGAW